jgi:DNA-binding MarR family transcriptional regulator
MTTEDARHAAAEAWRGLVDFWTKRNRWIEVAGELGISPGHAKALTLLAADDPPPMGVLAEGLHCDASFVTNIVDKLEEKGFAERRPSPTDRRVKTVVITDAGLKARAKFEAAIYEPPPELLDLSDADLKALARIVAKLPTKAAEVAAVSAEAT